MGFPYSVFGSFFSKLFLNMRKSRRSRVASRRPRGDGTRGPCSSARHRVHPFSCSSAEPEDAPSASLLRSAYNSVAALGRPAAMTCLRLVVLGSALLTLLTFLLAASVFLGPFSQAIALQHAPPRSMPRLAAERGAWVVEEVEFVEAPGDRSSRLSDHGRSGGGKDAAPRAGCAAGGA